MNYLYELNFFIDKKFIFPFGRICNTTALSICICNAKTMKFFELVGLQIQSSTRRIANPTEREKSLKSQNP